MVERRGLLLMIAVCMAATGSARSQDTSGTSPNGRHSRDHENARNALQQGKIRPLSDILVELRTQLQGEVIEVELEREGEIYIYEFKILAPSGRVSEVKVDAATGKILKTE